MVFQERVMYCKIARVNASLSRMVSLVRDDSGVLEKVVDDVAEVLVPLLRVVRVPRVALLLLMF